MTEFNITKGQVLKYSLLPQVFPRFQNLISTGFSQLSYFMALVYRATNILPDNHLYLKPESIGKYTIQDVLTEAAHNITFDLKHIDKVIIFFALIAGLFILAFQFFFLILMFFINPAAAQGPVPASFPTGIGEYFTTPTPEDDLAFRMLDSVFGVPGFFGSRELGDTETQFHQALHALYQLYSFGLLVIAVIILLYFIFAILAETAQTGTPFGKRYNHVWAPIRLVVGVGMLVPMTLGLNAGQYITLYAAKMGSGFATTGWIIFNDVLNDNTILDPETLVAETKISSLKDLSAFMMMAHACRFGYLTTGNNADVDYDAFVIQDAEGDNSQPLSTQTYAGSLEFVGGRDIHIRFGVKDTDLYTSEQGFVFPYCGEIVIQNTKPPKSDEGAAPQEDAAYILNEQYFNLINDMWYENFEDLNTAATEFMASRLANLENADRGPEYRGTVAAAAEEYILEAMDDAVDAATEELAEDEDYLHLGWAGAALWYNKIANVNGKLTTAAMNTPQIKYLPRPMIYTCEQNQQQNKDTTKKDCHDPNLSRGKEVQYETKPQQNVAAALSDLFNYWYKGPGDLSGNVFIDVINAILGTQGLFDMCENADTHPLAQLSVMGKGLVEAAIRNLGISMGSGAAGILAGYFGPTLSSASSFFGTVASIGILIGFILYYVVPFLPFLYFMFALGGWIKGLFEAMVGVPLWALAHLRIDGEGLPGDAAINGYFLIFEIFVRPILILFGLIAALLIFGAMVKVLNDIFTLAVSNLSGFSADSDAAGICGSDGRALGQPGTVEWVRGPIDELFFTIIYAIMVYMIGMASFKLIDLIPNNILRWMGQGVQTFNDQAGEPAEGLVSKVAIGGSVLGSQLQAAGAGFKGMFKGGVDGVKALGKK